MKKFKFNQFFQLVVAVSAITIFSRCEELQDGIIIVPIDEEDTTQIVTDIITDSTDVDTDTTTTDSDTTDSDTTDHIDDNGPDVDEDTDTYPTACEECDHIVNSYITDGKELNIQPGDIVCLAAGKKYDRLIFRNIVGTKSNPVIIRNCGGVAMVMSNDAFGIKFQYSKDFVFSGDGAADQYGIKVTTTNGFYTTFEKFTTDFEIKRIEVAGKYPNGIGTGKEVGFAAIGIKTSPYQDCDLFADPSRKAWIMRNISVHDNYIHDVGGEGLYIGHGMYAGRKESSCSQVTYSHSIKGLRVYNNLIENVGFDGMQIKNADEDVEVYNNVVRNYGTKDHNAHNEGLFIGEGTVGKFYNNLIDTGTGNGCQIQGMGNLDIFNNVFANSGRNGVYAAHGDMVVRDPNGAFNIFNNTIYNSGEYGYIFHNGDGGPKRFINNLVIKAGTLQTIDATTEMSNNLFTNNISEAGFANTNLQNYRLNSRSKAIDAGVDLRSYGIGEDCEGVARPRGRSFDIGAYEF